MYIKCEESSKTTEATVGGSDDNVNLEKVCCILRGLFFKLWLWFIHSVKKKL